MRFSHILFSILKAISPAQNAIMKEFTAKIRMRTNFLAMFTLSTAFLIFVLNCYIPQNISHITSSSTSLVEYGDKIYSRNYEDRQQSPLVVPEYRLVIFETAKAGCTVLKMLAHQMIGQNDKKYKNLSRMNLRDLITENGLLHLYNLNITAANEAMTSPNWTRAIFVRDPKARFLSAYLDKGMSTPGFLGRTCCRYKKICLDSARSSLEAFFQLASNCLNTHWAPQTQKMEAKYWPYINFVGHIENAQEDGEKLLRKVGMGAWEKFGKTGWGYRRAGPIFSDNKNTSKGTKHATNAAGKLREYYTPELERLVEEFYDADYKNPLLQLERRKIFV